MRSTTSSATRTTPPFRCCGAWSRPVSSVASRARASTTTTSSPTGAPPRRGTAEAAAAFGPGWLLFDPERRADPYPFFHELRRVAPVCWSPDYREWIMTNWADCQAIVRDHRFSTNAAHSGVPLEGPRAILAEVDQSTLLFMDPPDHTRVRGLVSQAFTPRRIEALRPRVAAVVAELIDDAEHNSAEARQMDVMAELAQPLPVAVICEMLGVPAADQHLFGPWSSAASRLLDGDLGDLEEASMMACVAGAGELYNYFNQLIESRRADPASDLLSALVQTEAAGDRLSEAELLSTVVLLFVAGHETTTNLIGNGTLALLRHPEQAAALAARADAGDAAFVHNAVEELLRYDPPVQITGRVATTDIELNGLKVTKGEGVADVLGAANRDPAHFPDPDRLDLGRADPHHLSFSQGIHYCLGAALARLEGEVAIPALLQRFPGLALTTDPPTYRDHRVLRGLATLPVGW